MLNQVYKSRWIKCVMNIVILPSDFGNLDTDSEKDTEEYPE